MTELGLREILKSPILFAMSILNIKPMTYQAQILEDDSEKILIVGGRQIGKSTMLAIKALWTAFVMPAQEILIIAPTERQAKVIYDKIYEMIGKNEFLLQHTRKYTIQDTHFDNGSSIRCLTAGKTGEFARGYAATMIIFDEAAFIPEAVFISIEPSMAVRGRQLILSGTPYGKRGRFWEIYSTQSMKKGNREWQLYKILSKQNPHMRPGFLEQEKATRSAIEFAQEYEAEFIDEVGLYFPLNLIMENAKDYVYSFPRQKEIDTRYILGVDIARLGQDSTAFVVVERKATGERRVIWAETGSKMKTTDTASRIEEIVTNYPIDMTYLDITGVGAGVLDILGQKQVPYIKGIGFTPSTKEQIYSALKVALEKHTMELNANDSAFLYQFTSYTAKYDVTGKLRISKNDEMHDDLVDALSLTFADEKHFEISVLREVNDYIDADIKQIIEENHWAVLGRFGEPI